MHLFLSTIAIIYLITLNASGANLPAGKEKSLATFKSRSEFSNGVASGPNTSTSNQQNIWHILVRGQPTNARLAYERIENDKTVLNKSKIIASNAKLEIKTIKSKGKSTITILLDEKLIDTVENAEFSKIILEEKEGDQILLFDTVLNSSKETPRIRATVSTPDA